MEQQTNNKLVIGLAGLGLLFLTVAGMLWWFISEQAELAVQYLWVLFIVIVASAGLACVAAAVTFAFAAWVRIRMALADVRVQEAIASQAERDAKYPQAIIAEPLAQVFVPEFHGVTWKPLHLDPRRYSNGHESEDTQHELGIYLARLKALTSSGRELMPEALLEPPVTPNLLEVSREFERALVVGNSGSGKTTLLQHMVASRQGQVVVLDPHDDTHTWPENAQVVGGGQDYESIESMLVTLRNQLRERYQTRATGQELSFGWLWVVMDEWREITKNTESAGENMRILLTGGRKVKMGVIIGSHSDRAKPLGIDGEADLKDGFAIIRLFGDKQRGFSATLDVGHGEVPVALPGPFYQRQLEAPKEPLVIDQPRLSEVEEKVLNAFDGGERRITALDEAAYGGSGGWQSEQVREIIKKHRGVEL